MHPGKHSSVQWVSRIELGENLTLATLEKIADVLDVTVPSLFIEPAREAHSVKRGRPRKA